MLTEPAVGKTFFGREKILHTLEKRVNAFKGGYRQNIALTGPMLSGKSSILFQFLYTTKCSSLVPVYIEVVEEPFQSFADRFIATLLYNYLVLCGYDAKKDLQGLIEMAEPIIPRTIYSIKKVNNDLLKKNYNEAYRELLNLTSTLKEETGKSCVVILDEFHNLEFLKIRNPYLHFGKIIMIQKDTMYIVSSSQKSTIKKILSEKLALLYGNFEIVEVHGFDNKTSQAFLVEKLQNITISQNYVDYLIDFTDGNPFYLDMISKKIVEIINSCRAASVEEEIIIDALTALIYNTNGTINQYFTNNIMNLLGKDLRADYLDILIATACGCNKLKDIAKWFNKNNTSGLSKKLEKLIELDIVYKNGVFYGIQDKVFTFWLKTVYHKKKTSLVDDIVNRTNDFKKEVKNDIGGYLNESQKNISERIKELFLLFDGETIEIQKKERRLPKFIKIEVHKIGGSLDIIAHQKLNRCWIFNVGLEKIEEFSVGDFLERYYPMRDKIARKIFIALGGVDRNALLLAKEKNIWVWNLKNINSILRLYKKHNLVYK